MAAEIVVGIIAGVAGVAGAVIGLLGKRDETKQSASEALISGQGVRIERLESRLDSVEDALRETRAELYSIQNHANDLRDALRRALAWIADAVEYLSSPDAVPEPPAPDMKDWWALLEHSPRSKDHGK